MVNKILLGSMLFLCCLFSSFSYAEGDTEKIQRELYTSINQENQNKSQGIPIPRVRAPSSIWPSSHPKSAVGSTFSFFENRFNIYLWRGTEGDVWVEIEPIDPDTFICGSSFDIFQNGSFRLYNNSSRIVNFENPDGSSFCEKTSKKSIFKVVIWSFAADKADITQDFILYFNAKEERMSSLALLADKGSQGHLNNLSVNHGSKTYSNGSSYDISVDIQNREYCIFIGGQKGCSELYIIEENSSSIKFYTYPYFNSSCKHSFNGRYSNTSIEGSFLNPNCADRSNGLWYVEGSQEVLPTTPVPVPAISCDSKCAVEALPYAKLSKAIYSSLKNVGNWHRIYDDKGEIKVCGLNSQAFLTSPWLTDNDWKNIALIKCRNINKYGFHASTYYNSFRNEVVAVFEGTDMSSVDDWVTNMHFFDYSKENQYSLGLKYVNNILKTYSSKYKVKVAGHSLGGGIAQYVAYKLDLEAYTFNSAGLWGATAPWDSGYKIYNVGPISAGLWGNIDGPKWVPHDSNKENIRNIYATSYRSYLYADVVSKIGYQVGRDYAVDIPESDGLGLLELHSMDNMVTNLEGLSSGEDVKYINKCFSSFSLYLGSRDSTSYDCGDNNEYTCQNLLGSNHGISKLAIRKDLFNRLIHYYSGSWKEVSLDFCD